MSMNFLRKLIIPGSRYCLNSRNYVNNIRSISTPQTLFTSKRTSTPEKTDGTMNEVYTKMMNKLGLDMSFTETPASREHLLQYEPKYEDLPPRSLQDSFSSATIPLQTDKDLQNKYASHYGHIRLGRLMEDMDMFAVWICHQHLKIPNLDENIHLPYTFVTILVDKVDFGSFVPKYNRDIRLSGHVCWVGRSSMEIVVWIEQMDDNGVYHKITRSLFLMAARNATNTKAAPVNPLVPVTDEEKVIYNSGEERRNRRLRVQNNSVFTVGPNPVEQKIIHDIFARTMSTNTMELNKLILPENCKWIYMSAMSNITASFPENRNAHNKVFGGYLMKTALEISWVCAFMFVGKRPRLDHICDISFKKPVDVRSFVKMSSSVVFTENNYVQIMTIADFINPDSNESVTSNVFSFTFSSRDKVPEVLPVSYHEAMWYLEGRRKLAYALGKEII